MGNMLGTSAFPWNCHEPTIHYSKQKGSGTRRVIVKNACILVQIWYYVLMHGSHQPKLGIWYEIVKVVTMRNHSLSMKPLRTIFKPGCGMRADDSALAAFWLSRLVSLPVIGRLESTWNEVHNLVPYTSQVFTWRLFSKPWHTMTFPGVPCVGNVKRLDCHLASVL
jgi:hypothetical protein